jgi:hypothetical protein
MRPGGIGGMRDLWQVSIEPVVDLNADGIVDTADMSMIVDHWGTDEPLCDIGPMPWGDGIVDVQDLIVLSEHLFEEEGLIACWALDETEGDIAYDSGAENDALVIGDALWQPSGGMVDGALQFDGIDDYLSTPFVLNPTDPEISSGFSVFAWIKGGAPDQVIISQEGGADWLLTDARGCIMTALESSGGRSAGPLISETTIINDNWHQVGLTWDGTNRIVYIDDVEVARDTPSGLKGSDGGLHVGAGKGLEVGTFFSGILDDVRIYSRAVKP